MSLLANLTTDASIENEQDVVASGGPLDTGIYNTKVDLAYLGKSNGGAVSLTLHLKTSTGRELRQTLWMTSGNSKGNKNYYEKNGEKFYLPGFNLANSLSLLTIGKEIGTLIPETKTVKLYDFDAKAEVPKQVDVLTDLLGQEIITAVFKQTVDKNVKDANGTYIPSGETREENEIDKFFRARDSMTTAEIRAQAAEPVFINTWRSKWEGVTRNRAKGATPGAQGTAGAPRAAAAAGKPTASLFG